MSIEVGTRRVVVQPDYFQFYMRRAGAAWVSAQVTDLGYARHLWTDGAFVYVGTYRKYGPVPVDIDVLPARPDLPERSWQHVVEVLLDNVSAVLEVFDWNAALDAPTAVVQIPESAVQLRCSWTGLVPDRFEGLDGDGESDERLLIQIWPAEGSRDTVVRWWPHWKRRAAGLGVDGDDPAGPLPTEEPLPGGELNDRAGGS